MKKGFTLTEALLSMSIIGIIVALTLPSISRLRPDETKIKYLKTYDTVSEIIRDLARNSLEYPITGNINGTNYNFEKYPLANTDAGLDLRPDGQESISHQNSWNDNTKLCHLLAWYLDNENRNNQACNIGISAVADPNTYYNQWANSSFTSNNGVVFVAGQGTAPNSLNNFQYNILVDVNGANNPNCFYVDANNCPNPDRFWFMVTADGNVHAADPMGKAYIRTRKNPTVRNMQDVINNNTIYSQWVNGSNPVVNVDDNNIDDNINVPQI